MKTVTIYTDGKARIRGFDYKKPPRSPLKRQPRGMAASAVGKCEEI